MAEDKRYLLLKKHGGNRWMVSVQHDILPRDMFGKKAYGVVKNAVVDTWTDKQIIDYFYKCADAGGLDNAVFLPLNNSTKEQFAKTDAPKGD